MAQSDLSSLLKVKAMVFDVDGVFTDGSLMITEDGQFLRSMNIRDGYAVKHAIDKGFIIIIISGGSSEGVRHRFSKLGVKEIHLGIEDKPALLNSILIRLSIQAKNCLYMGDDYPDIQAMDICGIKVSPQDAVWQIREKVDFITRSKGGEGAVREIIENVMTLQDCWD